MCQALFGNSGSALGYNCKCVNGFTGKNCELPRKKVFIYISINNGEF